MDEYQVMEEGIGGEELTLVHCQTDQKKYVLKRIQLRKHTQRSQQTLIEEMALLTRFRSPFLVAYKEVWVGKGCNLYIVMDYCEGGDMSDIVKEAKGSLFLEANICKWLVQLLLALDFLHSKHVVHGNLKCSNIFLSTDQDIQLGNYGFLEFLKDDNSNSVASPNNMCPEILAEFPYSAKSDMWALGCCMFEITGHRPAFRASDMSGLTSKINRSSISALPTIYSPSLCKEQLSVDSCYADVLAEEPCQNHPAFLLHTQCVVHPINRQLRLGDISDEWLGISPIARDCIQDLIWPFSYSFNSLFPYMVFRRSLIKSMLRKNPDQRPTAAELLKHPYLQKYVAECITLPQLISCPSPLRRTSSRRKQSENPGINHYSSLSTENDWSLCSVPSREPSSTDVIDCAGQTVSSQPISFSCNGDISNTPDHFISGTWNDQECNIHRSLSSTNSAKSIRLEPLPEDDNSFQFPKCPLSVSVTEEPPTTIRQRDASTNIELSYSSDFTTPPAVTNYQERAEALESLLELCAQLLQQRKLSELAGVLKPFGKNGASPRETAIWLTKSMKAVGDKQHSG